MQIPFSIHFHNRPYLPLPTILISHIAVLVAIAIPIFTSQLEKSRDSVSISNIRAAYAEASAAMLTSNGKAVAKTNGVEVKAISNGEQEVVVDDVVFKGTASGFSGLESELPFTNGLSSTDAATGGVATDYQLTFTFNTSTGACTLGSPRAAQQQSQG